MVDEHNVMTAEEAAAYLRIARATLYRLAAKREIPAVKVGRVWRFSRQLLDKWLEARMRANLEGSSQGRSSAARGSERGGSLSQVPALSDLSEPVLSGAEGAEGSTVGGSTDR
ncbi:MAG: helix-turn-helix domain-containing protein [Chloroflexota bacterium]|nr:helix-turn-helix domain-containing protein [Chloroflexota bacterium]